MDSAFSLTRHDIYLGAGHRSLSCRRPVRDWTCIICRRNRVAGGRWMMSSVLRSVVRVQVLGISVTPCAIRWSADMLICRGMVLP